MMRCEDVAGLLLPALRGTLTPDEGQAIGEHVAGCADCAHDLPQMQRVWTLLDSWPDEPPLRRMPPVERAPGGGRR